MAENKKVIIDPTKTGPLSYRDLQAQNANGFDTATQESEYTPEFQTYLNEMNSKYQPLSQTDADLNREQGVKSSLYDTDTPWGESMWDDDVANEEQFQHLGDIRANNQPWYAKIAAGVAKGALTAGTTIINSWVGLPVGIIESFKDGDVSRIWDNNLTRATQSLMDWGEKTFKNYRTEAEENDPWYKHILSANFLATGLIQNTGFMIGAAYSGGPIYKGLSMAGNAFVKGRQIAAVGKALGVTGKKAAKEALETAIKTGNGLNRVKNAINAVNKTGVPLSKGIAGIVASTIAGVGEGAIEAQNNSRDWYKSKKMKYDDEFNRQAEEIEKLYGPENSPEKQAAQDKLYKEYDSLMSNAAQEAARMGNWDLALNIPLLAFGDYKQFIRNWSGGWKTAKRLSKVKGGVEVKKGANGAIESIKGNFKKSSGKAGLVKAATKRAVLEGSEEMNQAAINKFAGYYTDDAYVTPFYNATKNPEAIQETLGYWNKFAKGIMSLCGGLKDTWGDFNNYEEFFIGALSGGFGLPTFRRMKNKDGSWQSPIAFKDSAYQDVQEYRNWMKKEEELVQRMNDRVQSPEFLNAYKNLVRNNKYQKDMDAAVEANSEVDFKDAQFNQLVSDIVMFDTAGRLDDLKELVKAATDSKNFSDEDLDQIVATTTDLSEEGKVISPFVDENGNVMSKEKIREQLEKNGKKVLEAIDSYQATKELLQNQINEEIPREGFEELVWMQVQLDGWRSRMSSMSKDIKTALKPVKERLKSAIAKNDEILKKIKKEDSTDKPKTKEQEEVEKLNKVYNSILNTIDNIDNMEDAADVVAALEVHPELGSLIHNEGGLKFLEQVIDAAEANRIVDLAKDIKTLNERSELFQKKLKEYTEDPQKVAEDQKKSDEKREKEAKDKKNKPARERLLNTKSPKEFRDVLNSLNDADREAILKEFDTDQGQPFQPYVDYKRTESYKKAVEKLIYNSGLGEQLQKDVLSLFNAHYNNSNSLEELGNRKSAIIQDSDFFTEDSESIEEAEERYNNALVALDSIMYKVNNNKVFSDSFTKEFKKAPEKITKKETGGGPIRSTDKDTTGSSGTSTVPPVVGGGEKETPSTVPPGSQSLEEMLEENKEQKDSSEEEQERVYKANREGNTLTFIIPAVPEMHVNAGGKITIKDKDTGEEKEVDVPYEDFYKVAAELEGKNFQKIWEYLRDAGAFEYVNSGKLEPGAEIGFMIDPNWEKQLEGVSWHKQPTIFLIDKKNGQIVGSLFESMYKQKEYAGLENLVKNIIEEYNANKNKGNNNQITGKEVDDLILDILESIRHDITESKYDDLKDRFAIPSITFHIKKLLEKYKDNIVGEDVDLYKVAEKIKQLFYEGTVRRSKEDLEGESAKMDEIYDYIDSLFGTLDPSSDTSNRFVYSKTTNVSAVINGKIPIGNTEQSIQNVNGVLTRVNSKGETETVKPLFAIVKNGTLVTGGKVPASKVVMPKNLSDKEGNLYLLVPNAKGQYTPMSLRVKHFNTEEFSLDDTTNANSVKGIELVKAITALSKISSTEDLHKAVASLKSVLFIPDNYHFDYYNNDKGSGIIIKIAEVDPLTKEEVYEKNDDGSFVLTESGKKKRKEETIFINFSSKKSAEDTLDEELSKAGSDEEYEAILASSGNLEGTEEVKDPATIQKEITDALLGFNLSFQVSIDGINTEGYNESLIVSDIITSNITDATCRSSWFTCDYFNDKGEKQGGKLPEVKHEETPSGDGSLIKSTEVPVDYVINGSTFKYKVNLDTGEIYQDSVSISHTFDEEKRALIYGMASYKYKYPNGSSADLDVIQHVYDVQNGVPQKTITAFVFNSKEGKTYVYDTANKKLVTDTELADAIISRLNKMNAPLGDCVPKFKTSKDTTTDTKEEPKKDEPKEEPKKEPLVVTSENDYGNNEHAIREGSVIQTFSIIDIKNPENPPIPTKAPVTELTTINGHKIFLFSKPYNERVEEGDSEDDSFNCWDYEFYAVSDNGKAVVLAQKKEVIMAAVEPKLQSRLVDVLNQKQDAIKVLTEDDGTNPPDNPEQPKKYSHGTPFGESDIPFNPPSAEPTEDKKDSTGASSVELNADELGDVFDDNTPNDDEYDYDDIDKYKKTNEEEVEVWNKEKELKWLDRVLPQLSREDRVRIVSGLINTAEAGEKAWGMVSKGIITLSDIAVKGTMYHEAFHIVFNYLLDENQKQKILEEARQRWGNLKRLDLEEELAEAFKEYTLTEDSRGLGRRILDFFKNLLTKITHWHRVQPHTYSLFRQINQGKFANMKENTNLSEDDMQNNDVSLNNDVRKFLNKFGITIQESDEVLGEGELFNALNRVIKYNSIQDLSKGVSKAIVFMMQYNHDVMDYVTTTALGSPKVLKALNTIKIGRNRAGKLAYTYFLDKKKAFNVLGEALSESLLKAYNIDKLTKKDVGFTSMFIAFLNKFNPIKVATNKKMQALLDNIVEAIRKTDQSLIVSSYIKPGDKEEGSLLDIKQAIRENPYEANIIKILSDNGIYLGGSASIAMQGTLYRTAENPMHDIDFNAITKTEDDIVKILKTNFKHFSKTNVIKSKGVDRTTLTYLIMDRPFVEKATGQKFGSPRIIYDAETGEELGIRQGSNLELKEGVQGKMLDFFIGKDGFNYGTNPIEVDGVKYILADNRGAMRFKVEIAREKDIWDYNRFVPNDFVENKEIQKKQQSSKYSKEQYTSEMQDIKDQAIKDGTFMKAPNGQPTKLNERQWLQVRTKAFKEWFGDWENVNKFNISAIDTSKVDIEEVVKPWKNDSTKSNKTLRIYLKNQHDKGYFELVKDEEFGMYSVHFKTINEKGQGTTKASPSTKEERAILYEQLINAIPDGAQVSTWGEVSKGGEIALNKIGRNMIKVGERTVKSKHSGQPISIPIYQKGDGVSKVVDENGEPLVVYHSGNDINFEIVDFNKQDDKISFFTAKDKEITSSYRMDEDSTADEYFDIIESTYSTESEINNHANKLLLEYKKEAVETSEEDPFGGSFGPQKNNYKNKVVIEDVEGYKVSENTISNVLTSGKKYFIEEEYELTFPESYRPHIGQIEIYNLTEKDLEDIKNGTFKKQIKSKHFIGSTVAEKARVDALESVNTSKGDKSLFENIKNPLIIDSEISYLWNAVPFEGRFLKTREISKIAKERGYDGVMFKNIIDIGGVSETKGKYVGEIYKGDHFESKYDLSTDVFVSFNSNQVKSATDNIGTFSRENDDIRYSLVGKKGLQRSTTDTTKNNNTIERTKAILKSLEDAKSMDSRKYTPLQIKRLTGWEKDYNGKWKYETVKDISISQEKVDSIKKEIENIDTMYDVPEVKYLFTELFKGPVADFLVSAYPELKDFTFVFFNNPSATYNGVTSDNEIAITHLDRNINDINDTILHEVQHFIQRMEGGKITDTSKGVDSDAVLNNPDFIKESSVPGLSEEQITQLKHKYYQKIGNESEAYAVQGRLAGKEYRHESIANKHIYDWEVLSEENRKGLERKGYTKEKWEQIDDFIFKDNALRCIAF